MYVNYEVLCNAFQSKIIDFSEAEIYKLKTTEMSRREMEDFIKEQNQYTMMRFVERYEKIEKLKRIEEEILKKKQE